MRMEVRTTPSGATAATRAEPAHRPAEEELGLIARDTLDGYGVPERVERWLRHPDERVVLAAMDRWEHALRASGRVCRRAIAHALDEAEREGVAWTPVLDHAAAAGLWVCATAGDLDFPGPTARFERLRTWIAEQATRGEATGLARWSRVPFVKALVGAETPHLDVDLVEMLARDGVPHHQLARNPAFPAGGVARLLKLQAERSEGDGRRMGDGMVGVRTCLDRMGRRGHAVSEEDVDALLALGQVEGAESGLRAVLRCLVRVPLPSSRLVAVLDAVRAAHLDASDLVRIGGEDAPIEFYRTAARLLSDRRGQTALAKVERALADDTVRRWMLRWGKFAALEALARTARAGEAGRVLSRMAEVSEPHLARWLTEGGLPPHTTTEDVMVLMRCEMRKVRLAALTHLNEAGARDMELGQHPDKSRRTLG